MAAIEIIDAELGGQPSPLPTRNAVKDDTSSDLAALYPAYSRAEREAALRFLIPSTHEVCLGAGWVETTLPVSPPLRRSSSSSSSSAPSTPGEPEGEESEALLVRSCSQGWTLSFELTPHQPVPEPRAADEVVVRNLAVGLNPVDWKSVSFNFGIPAFPWILGRDIAGQVVRVPESNTAGWKVGDRVWTCADSRHMRAGGYQRFSVHSTRTLAKLPDHITDQEAATLGTGLVTAAVALFAFFKLALVEPTPETGLEAKFDQLDLEDQAWILIYGGGAVTGLYAAQLARLSRVRVVAVASQSNFALLRSLGVDVCVDRHQPAEQILDSIRAELTRRRGVLRYAIDCVSSQTADTCLRALASGGADAQLIALAGNPKATADKVQVHRISFSTTFYHPDGVFAERVLSHLTRLLEQRALTPCSPHVLPDGLAGIRSGLEMLRDGKAPRARKLVVRIDETPAADVTHLGVRTELGWNGV